MKSKLINVRLNIADAAKAGELQKNGVKLSQLFRRAIRAEHDRLLSAKRRRRWGSAKELLQHIYQQTPIAADDYPQPIDLTNREEVSQRIRDSILRRSPAGDIARYQRNRRTA